MTQAKHFFVLILYILLKILYMMYDGCMLIYYNEKFKMYVQYFPI